MYDYGKIPEHMHDAMKRYLEQGISPGGFLTAVLENNLKEAVTRADDINRQYLVGWVQFLMWEVPDSCWGSPEEVKAWMEHGGLQGLEAQGKV